MGVKNFKETNVYKLAFEQAVYIFEISKTFPKEETYSLTDQIRRSSRVFVQILLKHIVKNVIRLILFLKYQTVIQKTQRQTYGLILQ